MTAENETERDEIRAEQTHVQGHHVAQDLYEFVLSDSYLVNSDVRIQGFIEELDFFVDTLKSELKRMKSHERSVQKANDKLNNKQL